MTSKNLKAIFFAYSSNAFDNLLPYAVLCREKNIPCTIILGNDFLTHKVSIKKIFFKILNNYNIQIYCREIIGYNKNIYVKFFFSFIWLIGQKIISNTFIPRVVKNLFRKYLRYLFNIFDQELLGKNIALKFLEINKTLVFVDTCKDIKLLNGFLSEMKGKAKIISVGHGPPHFTWKKKPDVKKPNIFGDVFLASNHIHFEEEIPEKRLIIGNLRYSEKWSHILSKFSEKKNVKYNKKKNVVILATQKEHTGDWNRLIKLASKIKSKNNFNLCFIPHIRGMSSEKPPKILKDVWDSQISLFDAVNASDIVLFWRSSSIFQAVLLNKKIFFLSFISPKDINFLWEENLSSSDILNHENEVFESLEKFSNGDNIDNEAFKKVIWPNGDPWRNVSNFLENI